MLFQSSKCHTAGHHRGSPSHFLLEFNDFEAESLTAHRTRLGVEVMDVTLPEYDEGSETSHQTDQSQHDESSAPPGE